MAGVCGMQIGSALDMLAQTPQVAVIGMPFMQPHNSNVCSLRLVRSCAA
jgi:hypothetical protein